MSLTTEHPVARRLAAQGIVEVVIIDDAFDVPDTEAVTEAEIEQFWADVRDVPEAVAELEGLWYLVQRTVRAHR